MKKNYKTMEDLHTNKDLYLSNPNSGMITCIDDISDIPADQKTALVYLRVSTTKIEQNESIEHQYEAALNFCQKHNLFITHILYEKETATSDVMRSQYSMIEPLIKQYGQDYLVTKCSDRLSRNIEGKTHLDNFMKNHNVHYAYFMDNLFVDINNPDVELNENMKALINSYYSQQQKIKANEYYVGKARRKELTSQNECFGYTFNRNTRQMEINEKEAAIVKKIFEMYVFEGKGITKISSELASLGFTHVSNQKTHSATVSPAWIVKVLKRTAYIGDMTFNHRKTVKQSGPMGVSKRIPRSPDEYIHAKVPAIVSKEMFDLAQEILAERTQANNSTNRERGGYFKGKHLFAGLVFCECGSSFAYKKDYRDPEKKYYFCSHNARHKKGICNNTSHYKILEKDLEAIVLSALNEWKQMRSDATSDILETLKKNLKDAQPDTSDLALYTNQKEELDKQAENLLTMLISCEKESLRSRYEARLASIDEQISILNEKIKLEEYNITVSNAKEDRLNEIIKTLDEFTEIKVLTREVILKHIEKIIIHYDGTIDIYMKYASSNAKMPLFNKKEGLRLSPVVKIETLDDRY